MSISIDRAACIGCGACVRTCPGNLIKLDEGSRAVMRRPRDCWGCAACVKACPTQAISYFLGADMGGRGTRLTVRNDRSHTVWTFVRPDGTHAQIVVNRGEANRY